MCGEPALVNVWEFSVQVPIRFRVARMIVG